jgi:broad specificity phosphatase PhoE
MSTRVRVWCVRHGESEANAGLPGVGNDSRLTELGRRQAVDAARELAAEPIVAVYSSPALRARQTADLLAATRGLHVTPLPELIEAECTAEQLRAWVVEEELGRCAEDGETGNACVARVTAAFERIAGAHPGETVVVVGHVASLTVALARLCALGATVWGTPLPNAHPFLVEWDGHAWRCPACARAAGLTVVAHDPAAGRGRSLHVGRA